MGPAGIGNMLIQMLAQDQTQSLHRMLNKTDIARSVRVVSDLAVFEVFIRQNQLNSNSICSPHPSCIFPIFICDHCGGRATVTNGIFIKSSVSRAHCAGLLSIKREIMAVTAGAGRGWSDQHNASLTAALRSSQAQPQQHRLLR